VTGRRREKTQINKIRDEKGDITTSTNEIQSIIRESFESQYSNISKIQNKQINLSMPLTNQN
jgi:RNA-binding protein YlmH